MSSTISRRWFGLVAAAGGWGVSRPASAQPAPAPARSSGLLVESHYVSDPSTYYEVLRPLEPSGKPVVVMIPGGAHTGACYLATADGRPGWAHVLARRGYPVIVADWPGTGRSGYIPAESHVGETVCAGLGKVIASVGQPVVVMVHSMSGAYGWKLLETHGQHISRLVAVAPAPPGNVQAAAEIVSETPTTLEIKGTTNYTLDRNAPFVATPGFVRSKLVGRSKLFPRDRIDAYAASLIPIPPRLLQQRLNIGGTQLRVANTAALKDKPVLVFTGTDDVDHPRELDGTVADWLRSAGARVDYWYLSDKGVDGNGHMMMLEENSDALAGLIAGWLES